MNSQILYLRASNFALHTPTRLFKHVSRITTKGQILPSQREKNWHTIVITSSRHPIRTPFAFNTFASVRQHYELTSIQRFNAAVLRKGSPNYTSSLPNCPKISGLYLNPITLCQQDAVLDFVGWCNQSPDVNGGLFCSSSVFPHLIKQTNGTIKSFRAGRSCGNFAHIGSAAPFRGTMHVRLNSHHLSPLPPLLFQSTMCMKVHKNPVRSVCLIPYLYNGITFARLMPQLLNFSHGELNWNITVSSKVRHLHVVGITV